MFVLRTVPSVMTNSEFWGRGDVSQLGEVKGEIPRVSQSSIDFADQDTAAFSPQCSTLKIPPPIFNWGPTGPQE